MKVCVRGGTLRPMVGVTRAKSSRTKWILLAIAALAIIAAVMAVMLVVTLRSTGLAFVQRHSAIELPRNVTEVDTFDNGETFVVAYVRLPDVAAFVQSNDLERSADPDVLRPYVDVLRPEHRTLPTGPGVSGASGRSAEHEWHALLDEDDGRLWIVVLYPDAAGDSPR